MKRIILILVMTGSLLSLFSCEKDLNDNILIEHNSVKFNEESKLFEVILSVKAIYQNNLNDFIEIEFSNGKLLTNNLDLNIFNPQINVENLNNNSYKVSVDLKQVFNKIDNIDIKKNINIIFKIRDINLNNDHYYKVAY